MNPIEILGTGMVTSVGLSAPASCAAIRAGIAGFEETRFTFDGEWLLGSAVPLDEPWTGQARLARLASMAVAECLRDRPDLDASDTPLLLAVAEDDRPGVRVGQGPSLIARIEDELGLRFHSWSQTFPRGRIGGVEALAYSQRVLAGGCAHALVAGVDSLLEANALRAYHGQRRLLTPENSDGFIPGEAAAAVIVGPSGSGGALACVGIGQGVEPAPFGSGEPFRADGIVEAFEGALSNAGWTLGNAHYLISDLSGPQFGFKEAALAVVRLLREHRDNLDLWHPADCVGETGAAAVPIMIGVVAAASSLGYAPGSRVMAHSASDGNERGAFLLEAFGGAD